MPPMVPMACEWSPPRTNGNCPARYAKSTMTKLSRSAALYVRDPRAFRHQKRKAMRDEEQYDAALDHLRAAMSLKPAKSDELEPIARKIRNGLSEKYYLEGKALLNSDLDQAIVMLEKAVDYDPDNALAQSNLTRARRMQYNLRRIEKLNKR